MSLQVAPKFFRGGNCLLIFLHMALAGYFYVRMKMATAVVRNGVVSKGFVKSFFHPTDEFYVSAQTVLRIM
jgi:hypothetical protein